MRTMNAITDDDRRIALEAIGRAAVAGASRSGGAAGQQAREVAEAMLAGIARMDGLEGPVVVLRGAWCVGDLADELEALAAEYRQREEKIRRSMSEAPPFLRGDEGPASHDLRVKEDLGAAHRPSEPHSRGA